MTSPGMKKNRSSNLVNLVYVVAAFIASGLCRQMHTLLVADTTLAQQNQATTRGLLPVAVLRRPTATTSRSDDDDTNTVHEEQLPPLLDNTGKQSTRLSKQRGQHPPSNDDSRRDIDTGSFSWNPMWRASRLDSKRRLLENERNDALVLPKKAEEETQGYHVTVVATATNDARSIVDDWGICDPRRVMEEYTPTGKVWIVSFSGWSDERRESLQHFQRSVATHNSATSNKFRLETLFFNETDLPKAYYDEFSWAFAKPHYNGFWTWKPWILRNLTETAIFSAGDLVLWMDSDERLRFVDDSEDETVWRTIHPYVATAFCNLELRNQQNYAGLMPFERCFNHVERDYTKPAVFHRMKLDADVYGGGEQLYAGSFAFRVTPGETLDFLREWENYARDPVLFGNDEDFPRDDQPAFPSTYQRHKNDQSVFSLMVRSRNLTTWPAPYFWMGDAGVQQCLSRFQHAGYCFWFVRPGQNLDRPCRPFSSWLEQQ